MRSIPVISLTRASSDFALARMRKTFVVIDSAHTGVAVREGACDGCV